ALLLAETRKSFFCLSAWRSSIIPHHRPLCKSFLQVFCSFLPLHFFTSFLRRFGLFFAFILPYYNIKAERALSGLSAQKTPALFPVLFSHQK
ncbi:hypothetical protein LKD23_11545, partial [Faecalibacterium sp. CLA-AA-H233]